MRSLTPRHIEVLAMYANGAKTVDVERGLGMAPGTLAAHRRGIYLRLDAHTITQAVAIAIRKGLVK